MIDPIDRDQAIKAACQGAAYSDIEKIKINLKKVPSVEIVRCKDCKHRPYSEDGKRTGFSVKVPEEDEDKFICPWICDDGWYSYIPEDDFYCANGERKDEA